MYTLLHYYPRTAFHVLLTLIVAGVVVWAHATNDGLLVIVAMFMTVAMGCWTWVVYEGELDFEAQERAYAMERHPASGPR